MPLVNYIPQVDNRKYEDILAEARTRIPRYTPEWTDLNDSDPGMTLVQLFAWMTDMMLYRLGKVPELNYLKFLELLGVELRAASPAIAEITFPVLPTSPDAYVIVPMRTQVSAEDPDGPAPIVFETDRALVALAARLASVQAFDGSAYQDFSRFNELALDGFTPFGGSADVDSAFLIGFDSSKPFPQVELDLAITVRDDWSERGMRADSASSANSAKFASADLVWEYWDGTAWAPLSLLKDETLALTRSGHIYLKTPAVGAIKFDSVGEVADPRYWIRARVVRSSYERAPQLLAVRTNTARATQAQTSRDEVLGGSDGRPDQVLRLANTPILQSTLRLEVNEGDGFVVWSEVEDFYGSSDRDQHYILDRTTGEIRFGNGHYGAIPVGNNDFPTSNIVAREYRFGGGARGNVSPGIIKTLMTSIVGIDESKVKNLTAAVAGRDEETLADAKLRVPQSIRSRGRAVTAEDFEQLAIESANIKRAKALPLFHPDFPGVQVPGVVTVIVVPDGTAPNPLPSEGTIRSVCAYLNKVRLLTTELYVVPPTYQKVHVSAEIIADDNADLAAVKVAVEAALLEYFHPLRGGEDGLGWPFGGDIFYSKVYGRVSVPGVERIERLTIELDGDEVPECTNVSIGSGVLVYSTDHDVSVTYSFDE